MWLLILAQQTLYYVLFDWIFSKFFFFYIVLLKKEDNNNNFPFCVYYASSVKIVNIKTYGLLFYLRFCSQMTAYWQINANKRMTTLGNSLFCPLTTAGDWKSCVQTRPFIPWSCPNPNPSFAGSSVSSENAFGSPDVSFILLLPLFITFVFV